MSAPAALSVHGLTKRYGDRVVVDGLTFSVARGSITGFLGENGAGKTTTIRLLLGLVRASAGSAKIGDVDVGAGARLPDGQVGALIENPALWPWLSADETLRVVATVGGKDVHADERRALLARVGLGARAEEPVRSFSLGMRQRLGLACALIGRPPLLLLDEPMNGLDPIGVVEMRELLLALAREGHTLLVSSHQLSEVQQLCSDVVLIKSGKLLYAGPMAALHRPRIRVVVDDAVRGRGAVVAAGFDCGDVDGVGGFDVAVAGDVGVAAADIARAVVGAGVGLRALTPSSFDLESFFVQAVRA